MKNKKGRKVLAVTGIIGGVLVMAAAVYVFAVNFYVVAHTKNRIFSLDEATGLQCIPEDVDCIIVLGAAVLPDGTPSHMLYDRIMTGADLYIDGAAPKIIMSGDHGREDYNEVKVMKEYALARGVRSEDIFLDHAGFSTYDSIYRAKAVFEAHKVIIVTQEYHLHRALYIAEKLGLEAYGVSASIRTYAGQLKRDIREILARNKDYVMSIIKPKPTYLGTVIPIYGDGSVTDE